MIIDILLTIIAIIALLIASFTDLKTREVPDWLSYSLIAIAVSLKLFYTILSLDWLYLFYTTLGFISFLLLGFLMYYSKQWGGGDAKLLMGLGIIFSTYPSTLLNYLSPNLLNIPFLLTLTVNIFIIGAIYGLLYSFVLSFKNFKNFKKSFVLISISKQYHYLKLFVFTLSIIIVVTAILLKPITIILLSLSLLLLIFPYLLIYVKAVENSTMIHFIPTSKLTEGDWIVNDLYINNKKIYDKKSLGVTKDQISLIKKSKIQKVLVKDGIPFVPSFLIATIISLIYGNIIFIF